MSHQVVINYEQIGIQCESICEVAEKRLQELEDMIAQIDKSSSKLLDAESKRFVEEIKKERDNLLKHINIVKQQAKDRQLSSTWQAQELQHQVDILSSRKIVQYKELLKHLLKRYLSKSKRRDIEQLDGAIIIPDEIQRVLDNIQDEVQRHFTYIAFLNDTTLKGNELIVAGQHLMGGTFESRIEEEKARIRAELEEARLDKTMIEKVMSEAKGTAEEQIQIMQSAATTEIVGEKVRKKSLKIIMQAIEARGFIVDKKNIKIQRETNEVVLVALKASGEKAEFRVFLDGKFIYNFRGYQGQACQQDIEPFMKDLEEVYGMHVKSTQEIWSNPDKNSTMKYNTFNTNKNRR
ncbi:MAG: hypothetical protein K5765_06145 [Clostridia bacterium]|nr:hypothetical protein [Clostridia bacterium]